jgi:glutamine amidotransferase
MPSRWLTFCITNVRRLVMYGTYVDRQAFSLDTMSKPKVVIVDYGVGNMLSVQRAVEECGGEAITSSDADIIALAERVVLPGVGAFGDGIKALESLGLVEVIKAIAADGIPLLGICLGMQFLFDESEERALTKGLGIIPGRVVPVSNVSLDDLVLKVPHIGWSPLVVSEGATWERSILQGTTPGDEVYFVHSFKAEPQDPAVRVADCIYGGNRISAVIRSQNVVGCQFHPEKSGETGLKILRHFVHT